MKSPTECRIKGCHEPIELGYLCAKHRRITIDEAAKKRLKTNRCHYPGCLHERLTLEYCRRHAKFIRSDSRKKHIKQLRKKVGLETRENKILFPKPVKHWVHFEDKTPDEQQKTIKTVTRNKETLQKNLIILATKMGIKKSTAKIIATGDNLDEELHKRKIDLGGEK